MEQVFYLAVELVSERNLSDWRQKVKWKKEREIPLSLSL